MLYKYETHCHSSQCSACGRSTAQELGQAYHRAGFAGLVLTDHFIHGNTAVDRTLPWEDRMHCYHRAYQDAREAAAPLDFDVIFGLEHAYGDGKEVLLYGIDLAFLLDNPDIPSLKLDALAARVKAYGGIVVQAHPYRSRSYVNMSVGPRTDLVDGIEVHNACNQPGEDAQALELNRERDYILTSGGDIHWAADSRLGTAGIALPYRIHDEKELAAALKRRDHQFLIGGKVYPRIAEKDLP